MRETWEVNTNEGLEFLAERPCKQQSFGILSRIELTKVGRSVGDIRRGLNRRARSPEGP